MLLVVEYWRGLDGRFFAESRDQPIVAASGDSLDQLKANVAGCIRDCVHPTPALYDLVERHPVGA